jgi:hypothetical protein
MAYPRVGRRRSSVINAFTVLTVLVAISPGLIACSGGEKSAQPQVSPPATASTTESGASSGAGSLPPPSAPLGHTPPSIVIDGRPIALSAEAARSALAGCQTSPDSIGNPITTISWAGGGAAGGTSIVANAGINGGINFKLSSNKSYNGFVGGSDPKKGIVTFAGPDNGWYTFTGTVAEEVRSEATGYEIPGDLHQVTVKVECAKYQYG